MAFSDALLARLDTDRWLVEAFSLKNRPHQGGTQGQAYGANAEYDSATPHASAQRSCWSTRTCLVTSSSTSSPQGPSRLGNLVSHQLRFTGERDANTLNLLYYTLRLDEPASVGASRDWGDEVDVTLEWEAGEHFVTTGVIGVLFPGDAAKELSGGADNWLHAMAQVKYSF